MPTRGCRQRGPVGSTFSESGTGLAASPGPPHTERSFYIKPADDDTAGTRPPTSRQRDRAVAALLGKRHTLAILYRFASDPTPWRFGELEAELGISPTTLSERLAELTAAGFLDRRSYDERPPRVDYTATPRLEGLKPAFTELYRWTGEYGPVAVD